MVGGMGVGGTTSELRDTPWPWVDHAPVGGKIEGALGMACVYVYKRDQAMYLCTTG